MSGYIGSTPVPQATQHRESFTCTEGQTTFNTAGYTAQFVDVYLNGSHLSPADFTATNGSDVVLAVAASADDVCDIISYTPFEVADQTFTGTTTMDVAAITGVLTTTAATVFNGGFASNGNSTVGGTFSVTGANAATVSIIAPTDNATLELRGGNSDSAVEEANIVFYQNNAAKWQLGNATDNAFKLYNYATSSYAMIVDATGAVTKPLQPAFLAKVASAQNNLANYVNVLIFGTEIFDQNADFNPSNGIFTAPVTGKYMLSTFIGLDQIPPTGTGVLQLQIAASNRTVLAAFDPIVFDAVSTKYTFTQSLLVDMDAGDTAKIQVYMPESTSTIDINLESYFSGYLAC